MIEGVSQAIINFISQAGYPAIFGLMVLESALIPIPSEITMPFAGFLASQGKVDFWLVVLIGAAGNLTGSLIAFSLGFWGQEKYVKNLIGKYGKFLLISVGEVEKAQDWFKKRGELIAFGSRLMPVVRTFISLPAGFSRMNVFRFSLYTFAGAFLWSLFLAKIGATLGENWPVLEVYFRKFEVVVILLILLAIGGYAYRKMKMTND